MTVCTGTAVSTGTIIMDLAGTDKRCVDRIRCRTAAYCIMTAVTGRIDVRYRCTMVNCGGGIRMDSFPRIRRRIMTRGTRYCAPGRTSCSTVCLGSVTVDAISCSTEHLVITGRRCRGMTRCTGGAMDISYYIDAAMAVCAVAVKCKVIRCMRVAMFC